MESPTPTSTMPYTLAELQEENIRLLQLVARLNEELNDYFMDREILTHLLDDSTIEDDE